MDFRRGIVLITVIGGEGLPDGITGRRKMISDCMEKGELGLPWLEDKSREIARKSLADGKFAVVEVTNSKESMQTARLMIAPYLQSPRLYIMGGGHIAVPLAKICRLIGYRIVVMDDRPQFASAHRFPEAEHIICCDFSNLSEQVKTNHNDSVIIVTRGHKHDLECLRYFLGQSLAYLGMIGSKRKIEMAKKLLMGEGYELQALDRVFMPVGLDIGAQTPEEIAVSIAAQLINEKRKALISNQTDKAISVVISGSGEYSTHEDLEILEMLAETVKEGIPAALVTILKTKGSTPRKAGAKMIVFADGRTFGSVGGGLGEAMAKKEALTAMNSSCMQYLSIEMTEEEAAQEGMVCGGTADFIIEPAAMFDTMFK